VSLPEFSFFFLDRPLFQLDQHCLDVVKIPGETAEAVIFRFEEVLKSDNLLLGFYDVISTISESLPTFEPFE
jgi:hypothetical protein